MKQRNSRVSSVVLLCVSAGVACSGTDSSAPPGSTGGDLGFGSTGGSAGSASTGGNKAVGGSGTVTAGSGAGGGTAMTGGTSGTGGNSSTSGTTSTGGKAAGGMSATGATTSTGGAPPTGGSKAAGGTLATGGASITGGSNATGGVPATGGTPATGGSKATGGAPPTGGTPATGGSKATGGALATGGTKATGGAPATGGSTATCSGSGGTTGTSGPAVTATVSFGTNKYAMPSEGLGVCTAVYDNSMTRSTVAPALKAAGIQAIRYPGGSYADAFNWQTTTMNGGAYINTSDSFDNFMNDVVVPSGAKAIITANYGSNPTNNGGGDSAVAAAWVQYANVTKGWGIHYWEIGNEVGGNGYYVNEDWEYDLHFLDQTAANRVGQAALSPTAYGMNAVAFINQMKAVDPTIKCGVSICGPGTYPDPPYNSQVLTACASVVDFVVIHWYPCGTDPAGCLQSPNLYIALTISATRTQLTSILGATRASQIEILITETGAGSVVGAPAALFTADNYLTFLENGVSNVDYQELHNYNSAYGFLTDGVSGVTNDSPEPAAYGAKMSSILAATGDMYVSTTSNSTLVSAHAVKKTNGHYSVMLVNKDPSNAHTITVNASGAALGSCGTRYDFGAANFSGNYPSSAPTQSAISGIGPSSFTVNVPAYTMTIVDVPSS